MDEYAIRHKILSPPEPPKCQSFPARPGAPFPEVPGRGTGVSREGSPRALSTPCFTTVTTAATTPNVTNTARTTLSMPSRAFCSSYLAEVPVAGLMARRGRKGRAPRPEEAVSPPEAIAPGAAPVPSPGGRTLQRGGAMPSGGHPPSVPGGAVNPGGTIGFSHAANDAFCFTGRGLISMRRGAAGA